MTLWRTQRRWRLDSELDFDEFKKLHAQCLASEETRAAYAKELKEAVGGLVTGALTSIIENDAAAKIQAMYKGKQARQDVERLKEEISAAEKEAANAAEFTGTDDEQAAATKLQAMQRGAKRALRWLSRPRKPRLRLTLLSPKLRWRQPPPPANRRRRHHGHGRGAEGGAEDPGHAARQAGEGPLKAKQAAEDAEAEVAAAAEGR